MRQNEEDEPEETDTEITSEEAIMSTDKKVIIKEKVTIEYTFLDETNHYLLNFDYCVLV